MVFYSGPKYKITLIHLRKRYILITNNYFKMAANLNEVLHHLADQLPDSATWKDELYEAYVCQKIEADLMVARRG